MAPPGSGVRQGAAEVIIVWGEGQSVTEVAWLQALAPGGSSICDEHYPERRGAPRERRPQPTSRSEERFLALGEGAQRYLTEGAATGTRRLEAGMAEAVCLAALRGVGPVDQALGLAAMAGRFWEGELEPSWSTPSAPGGAQRPTRGALLGPGHVVVEQLWDDQRGPFVSGVPPSHLDEVITLCRWLRLKYTREQVEEVVLTAQRRDPTHVLHALLVAEAQGRDRSTIDVRRRMAHPGGKAFDT